MLIAIVITEESSYICTCTYSYPKILDIFKNSKDFSKTPRIPTEHAILGNPGIFSATAMAMSIYKTLCEKFCKLISQEEVVCLSQDTLVLVEKKAI